MATITPNSTPVTTNITKGSILDITNVSSTVVAFVKINGTADENSQAIPPYGNKVLRVPQDAVVTVPYLSAYAASAGSLNVVSGDWL
jgi:hypothetical protein